MDFVQMDGHWPDTVSDLQTPLTFYIPVHWLVYSGGIGCIHEMLFTIVRTRLIYYYVTAN